MRNVFPQASHVPGSLRRVSDDGPFFPPPKDKTAYRDPEKPQIVQPTAEAEAEAAKRQAAAKTRDAMKRPTLAKDPLPLRGKPPADFAPPPESARGGPWASWVFRRPRLAGLLLGPASAWFLWTNFQLWYTGGKYMMYSSVLFGPGAFGGLYLLMFGVSADAYGAPTERSKLGLYSAIGIGFVVGMVLELKLHSHIIPK